MRNCTLVANVRLLLNVNSYHTMSFATCEFENALASGTCFLVYSMNLECIELILVQVFSYLSRKGVYRTTGVRS